MEKPTREWKSPPIYRRFVNEFPGFKEKDMLTSNTLTIHQNEGDLYYLTFPNLEQAGVVAAFTTRMGGASRGRYASMNMSFTNGDDPAAVKENYRILFTALRLDPARAVLSHQTHTDHILAVGDEMAGAGIFKERPYTNIDGLMTNVKNLPLVTQFADCVPLLFYDPVKKAVATSHAGWRGTVQEIGRKTVEKMVDQYGSNPADILAAIGPSIGPCCYEVDDLVAEGFAPLTNVANEEVFTSKENGKYWLNLQKANRLILEAAGLRTENICVSDLCTCCHSQYFHSHRATGGSRGNLAAVIALK